MYEKDLGHTRGKSGFPAEGLQKPSEQPTLGGLLNLSELQFFILKWEF